MNLLLMGYSAIIGLLSMTKSGMDAAYNSSSCCSCLRLAHTRYNLHAPGKGFMWDNEKYQYLVCLRIKTVTTFTRLIDNSITSACMMLSLISAPGSWVQGKKCCHLPLLQPSILWVTWIPAIFNQDGWILSTSLFPNTITVE